LTTYPATPALALALADVSLLHTRKRAAAGAPLAT
jgi:hypothetical protein